MELGFSKKDDTIFNHSNLLEELKNNLQLEKITIIDYTKIFPYDITMPSKELIDKCRENSDKKYKKLR